MTNNLKQPSEAHKPKVGHKSVQAKFDAIEKELENQREAIKYLLHYSKEFNNEIQTQIKKTT